MSFRPSARLSLVSLLVFGIAAALLSLFSYDPDAGRHATRPTSLERNVSCLGDVGGRAVRAGALGAAAGGVTAASDGRAHYTAAAADAGYAVRWAASPTFAAAACPEPRAEWWFVGAGAGVTHHSVLSLDNPRPADAVVDVSVVGQVGPVTAPGLTAVRVAAGSTLTLDLPQVAPTVGDVAVHVVATRGLVAASMSEKWSADAASKPDTVWVPDLSSAMTSATLLGFGPSTTHATLMVANPGSDVALVQLKFVTKTGTFAPAQHASFSVAPMTLTEVSLDDSLSLSPFGVVVSSQMPVVAGIRSVRGTNEVYAAPADPFAPYSVAALPDVGATQLILQGGSGEATVTVEQFDASGASVNSQSISLVANASMLVPLGASTRIVRVSTTGADIRGALVTDAGDPGASVIDLSSTASQAQVPVVAPGWRSWH